MLFPSSLNKQRKYSLEIVRLQEFTVIQEVSQMSHKPPVAQGDAVFEARKRKKSLSLLLPKNVSGFPQAFLIHTEALLQ